MNKRADLYLETSVVSMYFQETIPPWMEVTREFWATVLPKVNAFVSDVVLREIDAIPDASMKNRHYSLVSGFEVLAVGTEAKELADIYLRSRRLPLPDALHVAIASVECMDFLVTWNLRHLVKPGTKAVVRRVNMQIGLPIPQIVTPDDFFEEE